MWYILRVLCWTQSECAVRFGLQALLSGKACTAATASRRCNVLPSDGNVGNGRRGRLLVDNLGLLVVTVVHRSVRANYVGVCSYTQGVETH